MIIPVSFTYQITLNGKAETIAGQTLIHIRHQPLPFPLIIAAEVRDTSNNGISKGLIFHDDAGHYYTGMKDA